MTMSFRLRALNSAASRAIPQLLGIALLAAACASQPPPAAPAKAEKPDPQQLFAPGGGKIVLSPEGDWFTDEKGEYYLVEVQRKPTFKIAGDRVMLPPGAAFELVEERGDILVVKIYNPESLPENPLRAPASAPAALLADLAELKVGASDRLRLVPFNRGLPGRGQWRQGFELVDINGDGNLDIVHGPPRKSDGKPRIFLGDGAGGWRLWQEARFEGLPLDYGDVAVADFDGDGALDLAVAVHLRGLQVLRGDGQGTFRQWGEGLPYWAPGMVGEVPEYSSRAVEVVDWNRDGRPDLLTLGEGPRIVRQPAATHPGFRHGARGAILFLNGGGGKWERYDQGTGRDRLFGDGLAVGDFNGDGLADFAIASRVKGATKIVQLGKADGSWEEVSLGDLARPGVYAAVHAADLDGDGRDELLLGYVASGGGSKESWTGIDLVEHENGSWRRTAVAAEKGYLGGVTALTAGDIDGDGRQDLVALTSSGERWVLLGTANGAFVREASAELAPTEPQCQGYEVGVASLGGGRAFVVMGFAGEPGSEQIFDVAAAKTCPSEGSLEAWTAAAK